MLTMGKIFKHTIHLCMALFVLLSSVGVKAHTMYCHDTASVSLFVPPKACCDIPLKEYEEEASLATPTCCLVVSGDVVFEYENTVPDLQFADFSFDVSYIGSDFIDPQANFTMELVLEDQNLAPPQVSNIHRSLFQVYII